MIATVQRQLEILRRLSGKDRDEKQATEGVGMGTWKNAERRIATMLGGTRVPVTGRQQGSAPDIEHPRLTLEGKTPQGASGLAARCHGKHRPPNATNGSRWWSAWEADGLQRQHGHGAAGSHN